MHPQRAARQALAEGVSGLISGEVRVTAERTITGRPARLIALLGLVGLLGALTVMSAAPMYLRTFDTLGDTGAGLRQAQAGLHTALIAGFAAVALSCLLGAAIVIKALVTREAPWLKVASRAPRH